MKTKRYYYTSIIYYYLFFLKTAKNFDFINVIESDIQNLEWIYWRPWCFARLWGHNNHYVFIIMYFLTLNFEILIIPIIFYICWSSYYCATLPVSNNNSDFLRFTKDNQKIKIKHVFFFKAVTSFFLNSRTTNYINFVYR